MATNAMNTTQSRQPIEAQWDLVGRLPAPRQVRSRFGPRIAYGGIFVIGVLIPAIAASLIVKVYFEREIFRRRGVTTLGRVDGVSTRLRIPKERRRREDRAGSTVGDAPPPADWRQNDLFFVVVEHFQIVEPK